MWSQANATDDCICSPLDKRSAHSMDPREGYTDVIIRPEENVTTGLGYCPIARVREASPLLQNISDRHVRQPCLLDHLPGMIAGIIVHDEQFG